MYVDAATIWRVESADQLLARIRVEEPWACGEIAWLEGRVCPDHPHDRPWDPSGPLPIRFFERLAYLDEYSWEHGEMADPLPTSNSPEG